MNLFGLGCNSGAGALTRPLTSPGPRFPGATDHRRLLRGGPFWLQVGGIVTQLSDRQGGMLDAPGWRNPRGQLLGALCRRDGGRCRPCPPGTGGAGLPERPRRGQGPRVASLTFEQSYGWIEGDSVSSAELYCLLSALADVPLRQDVAVTGSVNQHGEVQAVGGINESSGLPARVRRGFGPGFGLSDFLLSSATAISGVCESASFALAEFHAARGFQERPRRPLAAGLVFRKVTHSPFRPGTMAPGAEFGSVSRRGPAREY
jgi:hypothetical protein